jgi:hypothetical protein
MKKTIPMSSQSFTIWKEYHDMIAKEMRTTPSDFYKAWLSKQPEHVARLALIIRAVNEVSGDVLEYIPECDIRAAIKIADVLKVHARRIANLTGENEQASMARKVLNWITSNRNKIETLRQKEGIEAVVVKPKDIAHFGVAGINTTDRALAVLDILDNQGHLQRFEHYPTGQKRQTVYYVRAFTE